MKRVIYLDVLSTPQQQFWGELHNNEIIIKNVGTYQFPIDINALQLSAIISTYFQNTKLTLDCNRLIAMLDSKAIADIAKRAKQKFLLQQRAYYVYHSLLYRSAPIIKTKRKAIIDTLAQQFGDTLKTLMSDQHLKLHIQECDKLTKKALNKIFYEQCIH